MLSSPTVAGDGLQSLPHAFSRFSTQKREPPTLPELMTPVRETVAIRWDHRRADLNRIERILGRCLATANNKTQLTSAYKETPAFATSFLPV